LAAGRHRLLIDAIVLVFTPPTHRPDSTPPARTPRRRAT